MPCGARSIILFFVFYFSFSFSLFAPSAADSVVFSILLLGQPRKLDVGIKLDSYQKSVTLASPEFPTKKFVSAWHTYRHTPSGAAVNPPLVDSIVTLYHHRHRRSHVRTTTRAFTTNLIHIIISHPSPSPLLLFTRYNT